MGSLDLMFINSLKKFEFKQLDDNFLGKSTEIFQGHF